MANGSLSDLCVPPRLVYVPVTVAHSRSPASITSAVQVIVDLSQFDTKSESNAEAGHIDVLVRIIPPGQKNG